MELAAVKKGDSPQKHAKAAVSAAEAEIWQRFTRFSLRPLRFCGLSVLGGD